MQPNACGRVFLLTLGKTQQNNNKKMSSLKFWLVWEPTWASFACGWQEEKISRYREAKTQPRGRQETLQLSGGPDIVLRRGTSYLCSGDNSTSRFEVFETP